MRAGLAVVLVCAVLVGSAVAVPVLAAPDGRTPASGPVPATATDRSAASTTDVPDRCPGGPTEASREAAADLERGEDPGFVELHPNPTTHGNVGEFFVVVFPEETRLANWTVTDGHATARLPNETVSGRVAFSVNPNETRSMTADPVLELEGYLRLAADGDRLELRDGDRVVDAVAYNRAPSGETWHRTDGAGGVWWPAGATCLPPIAADGGDATTFVLPDAPEVPLETLAAAEDRILLAGYTYASEEVTAELLAAADRGVEVTLLLEADPVGGTPAESAAVLDELVDAGVTVRVLGGEGARYAYHHPKYAVVDDRAMVLTENWKPSGVGGASSRGWGVVVDDAAVADPLAEVFAADAWGRDTTAWERHRDGETFVADDEADVDDAFEPAFEPESVSVDAVEVLLAPDNAEARTLELLGSAEESIRIEQVRIGDRDFPLLAESLEAARRGVEVRILLDATWYVEDENRALVAELERIAEAEDLPLEVRLVEPDGRFEKIHAKGVVIDEEVAIVGSPNWNENAFRENREVALVLHGEEAGAYYAAVFDADWGERSWPLPVDLVGVVVLGLAATGLLCRRYVGFVVRARSEKSRATAARGARAETDHSTAARAERTRGEPPPVEPSTDAGARAEPTRTAEHIHQAEPPPSGRARADSPSRRPAEPDKADTETGERLREQ